VSASARLDVGYLSHPGRVRQRNEDNFSLPPADLSAELLATKGRLYLVADGMGGHQGGQWASQVAAQRIAQEYYRDPSPDPQHSLARAIHIANAEIYQHAQRTPGLEKMGTTVTAAVVRGQALLVANVGDSRTYLVRGGSALQLTQDHSLIAEGLRDGMVTSEQVASHPYRSVITRALGSREEVQPDFYQRQLQPGDALLLCSDGLTNEVDDPTIAATIAHGTSAQEATGRLVEQANRNGGNDNITAIIVRFAGARPVATARPARTARIPPWLFLVAGGLVVVSLVFAALLLFSGPAPTATPAQVAQETPAASGAVITTTLPPGSVEPGTPGPAVGDLSTSTPSTPTLPVAAATAGEGTPTLTMPPPTSTEKARSPATPLASPSPNPTATPKPTLRPAPVLDQPDDGATIKDAETVMLEWHWDGTLGPDDHFDVRVWREGQDHLGVAWTEEPFCALHMPSLGSRLLQPDPKGRYEWAIAVVRGQGGQVSEVLSAESSARWFNWEPGQGQPSKKPGEEPPPGGQPPSIIPLPP
jgi:serine/threonine protein phosphatase PrpC